jgi:excisionase family DNA binding protein
MTVRIGYLAGEVCHDLDEGAYQGWKHGYESHSQERDTGRTAKDQAALKPPTQKMKREEKMPMTKAEDVYNLMLTEYPDLLTAEQTAKILSIDRHQVYKLIDRGELFGVKLSGAYKISKLRLIEFLIGQVA